MNRYIEELVERDAGEAGQTFVEAASEFMKSYESVFAEEFPESGHRESEGLPRT
ncbi:hypothetical protein H180DRAFT_05666 [Streptomyces sp. WMMB 322]|nr:hypothetical protein H180DRAFT_05666 [Streptomyces sp. WMMB 322]